jgi:uncharacterized membrane protein
MSTVTKGTKGFAHWMCRTPRWALPLVLVGLGALLAGAMALGGQSGGWWVLAVFAAYGAFLFALSPRSEVVALMSGGAGDERQRSINEKASAATFSVLVVVLVGGFVVTTALGSDLAGVFSALSAFAGLTWLTALVVLTRRG